MHLVYNRKKFFGFTTPMLFFYIVFMFLPIGVAVYYSLTNYRGAGGYDFVGMANYSRLVGEDLESTFQAICGTLNSIMEEASLLCRQPPDYDGGDRDE